MARAKRRKCAFCSRPLPTDAHPSRKYCDADCRNGKTKPPQVVEDRQLGPVQEATEEAIAAAADQITKKDAGTVAALRYLARKIDTEGELRERAIQYADEHDQKPPPIDNVSVPTYLKYCEALGLTVASRAALDAKKSGEAGGSNGGSGTLSGIRGAVPRPA